MSPSRYPESSIQVLREIQADCRSIDTACKPLRSLALLLDPSPHGNLLHVSRGPFFCYGVTTMKAQRYEQSPIGEEFVDAFLESIEEGPEVESPSLNSAKPPIGRRLLVVSLFGFAATLREAGSPDHPELLGRPRHAGACK